MESPRREATWGRRVCGVAIAVLATAMVIYQLISAHYYLFSSLPHQNVHLGFALLLVFLVLTKESRLWWLDLAIALISLFCIAYVGINAEQLELNAGDPSRPLSVLVVGALLGIVLIIGTWRSFGASMAITFIVCVLYAFFGYLLPGFFQAPYVPPARLLARMTIGGFGSLGIYGNILGMSANEVFLFMVFGPLLIATGGARLFEQVGRLVGRKLAGGPAMTAVISSSMVGMITGSVIANVAAVGSFTIPLMKKVGYRAEQAGAIEAAASTGGQIMPPVMGVVVFLMVSFTGIPYAEMMGICALPAILWFLSVGLYVQFQALRLGIKAKEELVVDYREMLIYGPLFFIPLVFLIVLIIKGFSLAYSMSLAIVVLIVVSYIRKETRLSLGKLLAGIREGATTGAQVAVTCGAIGLMVAALNATLIPLKFPTFVETYCGGNLYVAILLTAIVGVILGTAATTTQTYMVMALVCAPLLIAMGLTLLEAHMFVLILAALAFLTPPVAQGPMVAAKVAGSDFNKTCIEATKVASGPFLLPLLVIWCPVLILRPDEPVWAVLSFIGAFVAITALQVVFANHYLTSLSRLERATFAIIAVMLVCSFATRLYLLAAAGIILFVLATYWQWAKRKRNKRALEVISYSSSPSG